MRKEFTENDVTVEKLNGKKVREDIEAGLLKQVKVSEVITGVNQIVQQLPFLYTLNSAKDAVRLRYPLGCTQNDLMIKGNGQKVGVILKDNKIFALPDIVDLSLPNIQLGFFTAMSFVTGQYFLFQINKELERINKQLKEILLKLDAEGRCKVKAYFDAIQRIYKEYCNTTDLRALQAYMNAIIQIQIDLKERMENYKEDIETDIQHIYSDNKINNLSESSNKYLDDLKWYQISGEVYLRSIIMKIILKEKYEEDFIVCQKKEILDIINEYNRNIQEYRGRVRDAIINKKRKGAIQVYNQVEEAYKDFELKRYIQLLDAYVYDMKNNSYIYYKGNVYKEICSK